MNIEKMIAEGATVVDVRSSLEFMMKKAPGTINIPLNKIPNRINEFKNMNQPVILCCQSGNRSGQACQYLKAQGIACHNAGSWMEVRSIVNKKSA